LEGTKQKFLHSYQNELCYEGNETSESKIRWVLWSKSCDKWNFFNLLSKSKNALFSSEKMYRHSQVYVFHEDEVQFNCKNIISLKKKKINFFFRWLSSLNSSLQVITQFEMFSTSVVGLNFNLIKIQIQIEVCSPWIRSNTGRFKNWLKVRRSSKRIWHCKLINNNSHKNSLINSFTLF